MALWGKRSIVGLLRYSILVLGFQLLVCQTIWAKPVDVETARRVAERWTGENLNLPAGARAFVLSPPADLGVDGALYFFELQPQGLAVVAADDVAHPVVFYTDGRLDLQKDRPPQFDDMIRGAANAIRAAQGQGAQALPASQREWQRLTAPAFTPRANVRAGTVAPLLNVYWNQGKFYNTDCPYDPSSRYDSHCLVGCVAVSMSQIMRFHGFPAQGTGSHQYTDPYYGQQSANFGATSYDWGAMPIDLTSHNSAVATLLYQAGVSVNMGYGTTASSAYQNVARDALVNYFGYSASAQYVTRAYYDSTTWLNLLYADLDAGRPLVYAGDGPSGGHSFDLDGYDSAGYFHVNWGWGGSYNGYFYLDDLSPASDTFNSDQCAIVHIRPAMPTGGDLIVHRVFMSTSTSGTPEVTAPAAGTPLYFFVEYSWNGTAEIPGCAVAMQLDGTVYAQGSLNISAGADNYLIYATRSWIATMGNHSFEWTLNTDNALPETNTTNDSAQASFPVSTAIVSPTATTDWMQPGRYWIMWEPDALAGKSVRLDLFRNGALFSNIKKKTNNKGSFRYTVKKTVPSDTTYQVVLSELTGQMRVYQSDTFSIGAIGAGSALAVDATTIGANNANGDTRAIAASGAGGYSAPASPSATGGSGTASGVATSPVAAVPR